MNTSSQTVETGNTEAVESDENAEVPCYCFIVDKPNNTSTCKMTSRCGNASGAVSDLMETTRSK